ncbi:ABC transporter permease [Methanosphaerula palustris]|uniref:ABC-2 type transporter n=1 Tax=Methanosphaerula palustris (strain ATCC BAA-1556 / DSM 19958 / E1-9c) TaxID=521011 RepID=B8GDX0_METPE|nr:ABC transporter permease [Methanosphaerula palustris]ACL17471.1 ABC-2 type transporter [Methanosphaerula palustris E1-9c]
MTSTAHHEEQVPTLIIRPPRKWVPIDFQEIWAYRELLYFFTWRDVKIRYKQTGLGFAWAIIQPLFTMLIFTLIFGGFAHIPSDGIPYPLFSYAALLPWTLFAEGMTRSTNSMVVNAPIMTKVYFPRLLMPISGIMSPLVDFCIAFLIMIAMMFYYGFMPTLNVVFLPLFLLLAIGTSLGVGLWLSALNVQYRDFQYTVPFLIQIWMYASPVVYPASMLPESLRVLYGLNPMAGVIEGFRWALLGSTPPSAMILVSVGVVVVLLVSGLFYFKKMEQYFADLV